MRPALTLAGRQAAVRLARRLRKPGLGGIASSNLRRARETAEVLAEALRLSSPTTLAAGPPGD